MSFEVRRAMIKMEQAQPSNKITSLVYAPSHPSQLVEPDQDLADPIGPGSAHLPVY